MIETNSIRCKKNNLRETQTVIVIEAGKFKSVLCRNCNMQYEIPQFILNFFTNASKYGNYLFVPELAAAERQITAI